MENKKKINNLSESGYTGKIMLKGREVQEILKISRSKLKQMVSRGEIEVYRLGNRTIRYSAEGIQKYLDSRKVTEQLSDAQIQSGVYSGDEVSDLTEICGNVEFAD